MRRVGELGQKLTQIFGQDLAGCEYRKLYSLGLTTHSYRPVCEGASEVVKRAHSLFYPSLNDPSYFHMASLYREPLVDIVRTVEGRTFDPHLTDSLIRETAGLVSVAGSCVMFTSGYDSRRVKKDPETYTPRFVPLLDDAMYHELIEEDPQCFLKAIRDRLEQVPLWETTAEEHHSYRRTE